MMSIAAFAANTGNGQRLYAVHCAGCHGMDGISVMPQAQNLARFDLYTQPDQNLIDVIRSGRNMMPSYLGILKENDILDVVSFLRTLR
jgi:cytochrome c6